MSDAIKPAKNRFSYLATIILPSLIVMRARIIPMYPNLPDLALVFLFLVRGRMGSKEGT